MFGLDGNVRYFLCQEYVDMRKGINGLYNVVKGEMELSPVSGDVFIFFSKTRKTVKLLKWDDDGFILYQKRLEEGSFEAPRFNHAAHRYELSWDTFSFIMRGVSLKSVRRRKRFSLPVYKSTN